MSEIRVKSTGTIKLFESDNTSHVTIASPSSLSANRTITIPDADVNLTNVNSIPTLRPNVNPLIINGDMQVAQRGASFSQPDTNNDAYPVDRFSFQTGAIGVYTSTQETLSSGAAYDDGFRKAARIDCTTAQASPAAGDYFWFQYKMEAQDCLLFKKGTSSAEKMTVAFWVKSNKTGTSQLTVKDGDNDRICAGTYAISSANTWEHKIINIAADTSGAFNNDNGAGFIFEWWLGAGSSYSSGTVPTAWEARTDADRGVQNLSINDNTANDWAITGIQVEVGEYTSATIPPFQHESYGANLERCKRYCFMAIYEDGTSKKIGDGYFWATTEVDMGVHFNPQMRANPTLIQVSGDDYFRIETGTGTRNIDASWNIQMQTKNAANCYVAPESAGTIGMSGNIITYNSNARFGFDAEL